MIIKIDHIAFSSMDFEKDIKIMRRLGYNLEFEERDVKNLEIKRKLMDDFSKRHDLALLSSKKNIPVELINHRHVNAGGSYISPIKDFLFNKILVKTENIKKSIDFWNCLGFRVIKTGKNITVLEFSSPFGKNVFQIYLQKVRQIKRKPLLDDKGFNCIAFISNSAKKEKEFLSKNGVDTTKIEQASINKKKLNIFFAIGPQGELAEIISTKD